ncbi:hypothetical protein HPB47_000628 [Ixodes persulcatus]|uniref:Uncharacterized protein n=1 Tax=Ixodes persulcatus TaxID=34615 RepID=A0AC60PR68_IXOPE|nr:hypothetical protein HPB47_000628 [Ixodes persulcatus]
MADRGRAGGSSEIDVTKPIKHMLAFIEQEANEKGLYQLLDPDVTVFCRRKDAKLVQAAVEVASKVFKKKTGIQANVTLDKDNFLPEASTGGVEMSSMKGKVRIVNTLESRLELISQKILPQIRVELFGKNPDRKHTD